MESKVNQVPPNLSRGLLQSVELHHYILNTSVFPRESEFLRELRAATASHPAAVMGTSPDEGPLIEMLLKMINAKKTIELGVFTGYSLLLTALSIPDDGKILAIDIDREAFNIGLPIIKKAGVEEKVEFVQSEAIPVLDKLLENNENEGSFDFAFVDADKINYWNYHERLMKLVRIGGIVVYDNTLWGGTVVMPPEAILTERRRSSWACTLDFNNRIASDSRVHICLAPFGDGVTICRRI